MAPAKLEKNDIAIAQKAICLARGLSDCETRTAGGLIAHFNKESGQCDPSIERLATMLGIDPRTVKRATAALCDEKGHNMFRKQSHGGKSGRASYTPIWPTFRKIVIDWERRMRTGAAPETDEGNGAKMSPSLDLKMPSLDSGKVTEMSPSRGRKCPLKGGENVPQTLIRNSDTKLITSQSASECDAEELMDRDPDSDPEGLLREGDVARFLPNYQARERAATAGSSHKDAARSAARHRINAAIARAPADWQSIMWVLTNENDHDDAVAAEVKRRGEGFARLEAAVRLARLHAGSDRNVH